MIGIKLCSCAGIRDGGCECGLLFGRKRSRLNAKFILQRGIDRLIYLMELQDTSLQDDRQKILYRIEFSQAR